MIEECPHCHARVLPMADRSCPACSENIDDLTGVDVLITHVHLAPATVCPRMCCSCATETDAVEQVGTRRTVGDQGWLTRLAMLVLVVLRPASAGRASVAYEESLGTRQRLTVEVPRCASCQREGALVPVYTSYEKGYLTLEVHRRFAEQVHQLNP